MRWLLTILKYRLYKSAWAAIGAAQAFFFALALVSIYLSALELSFYTALPAALGVGFSSLSHYRIVRIGLVGTVLLSPHLGFFALLAVLFVWLSSHSSRIAFIAISSGFLAWHFGPHIVLLLPETPILHLGSLAFLWVTTIASVIVLWPVFGWRHVVYFSVASLVLSLFIFAAAFGGRLLPSLLSDPVFRICMVSLPTLTLIKTIFPRMEQPWLKSVSVVFLVFFVGGLIVLTQLQEPVKAVVFDESHGKWETTLASFEPDDFGRDHYYTYSELLAWTKAMRTNSEAEIAESVPKSTDEMYVIKMPTIPLSESFRDELWDWVTNGGRLLIIADHTNLYDSTRYINTFLAKESSLEVAESAVFDHRGMPNRPNALPLDSILGRLDANGLPMNYQTGASFSHLPLTASTLASYGNGYSEPADYSRPNRFGTFSPRLSLAYGTYSSVVATPHGSGVVLLLTDSTPWSNFAIVNIAYQRLLAGIIKTAENPLSIRALGHGVILLLFLVVAVMLLDNQLLTLWLAGIFSLVLAADTTLGIAGTRAKVPTRTGTVQVVSGDGAIFEYLSQLVPWDRRNYARIVAALGKYGLPARVWPPSYDRWDAQIESAWLFIEPNTDQLPVASTLLEVVRRGNNVVVLFNSEAAGDPDIHKWLNTLGLVLRRHRGLAFGEGLNPSLLERDGRIPLRFDIPISIARPSSWWVRSDDASLAQVYQPRYPLGVTVEKPGQLTLSFSAEQFSDIATGEVWEGIYPNWLGKEREVMLASLLSGKASLTGKPPEPARVPQNHTPLLQHFTVLEDGKVILSGKLSEVTNLVHADSLGLNPYGYLTTLEYLAEMFLEDGCEPNPNTNMCQHHLIAHDLTEWVVRYQTSAPALTAIELIHDRRFSGLGATYNIVFSAQ